MNNYVIEVRALGYDTAKTVVAAPTLWDARLQEHAAVTAWLEHNDIGEDSRGLAFVRIARHPAKPVATYPVAWTNPATGKVEQRRVSVPEDNR